MRAKIASFCHAHPFEERFMNLDDTQLTVLYGYVLEEEKNKQKDLFDIIQAVNNAWVKNFKQLFDDLNFFVNPEIYQEISKIKETAELRAVINEENFEEEWEQMLNFLPSELKVQYAGEEKDLNIHNKVDIDSYMAGFVPYQGRKRGGHDGNG
jgi:hypothetical protein